MNEFKAKAGEYKIYVEIDCDYDNLNTAVFNTYSKYEVTI